MPTQPPSDTKIKDATAHPVAPGAFRLLCDLAAPIALYYGLRAAGVGIAPALVAAAAAPVGSAIVHLIRHRRIDTLAVTVLILIVLSAGASVIAGSPRFLLAKDAALTAAWGTWFLVSVRASRPLTFRFTRPLLEGRRIFDPHTRIWSPSTERSWDELWDLVPRFRRIWQVTTVIWSVAFLLDAAVRGAMAYALPVNDAPALAGALWLVTFLLLQIITNIYLVRSGLWALLRSHQPTIPVDPSAARTGAT